MQEENYDLIFSFEKNNWWYKAKRDLIQKILSKYNVKSKTALDLGCGVGSNYKVLRNHSKKLVGIDFSEKSIEYCKAIPYDSLHKMDATNLKFKENSFDLIVCSDVLEHLDDKKAIREITRVLKPGGLFLFSVPAHYCLWGPTDVISLHMRRYEKKRIFSLLKKEFNIKKISYWNLSMFFPDLVFNKILKIINKNDQGKNSLEFIPKFLNEAIYGVLSLENVLFTKLNIPQGVSIVGLAEKK